MNTLIKASQAISGETDMRNLLKTIISVIIENTKAEKGFLILRKDNGYFVEAKQHIKSSQPQILKSIPINNYNSLSSEIVHYVIKTKETLILDNAFTEKLFANDEYIAKHQTKSVICSPVINQQKVIAVLYLENNYSPAAFTPKRIENLKILTSQTAISIENIQLIENLNFEIIQRKNKETELLQIKKQLENKTKIQDKQLTIEKKNAERANRTKNVFLTNMSHELRTPLNAVLGYSEILRSQENDNTKKQYLKSIISSGKALLKHINDILDLSKIKSGNFDLQYTVVSIKTIFEDIKTIFYHKATDKGLDFEINIAKDIPELLIIDETRFKQILINLISNAIKFTSQGHVLIQCKIFGGKEISTGAVNLKIDIEDTGKGISKVDLDHIFNAFEQTKNQDISQYDGIGLGLAISQNLAMKMNGKISVKSYKGKNSIFTFFIKQVEIGTHFRQKETDKQLVDPDSIVFEPANILIVDDISYNLDIIAAFLQPYGLNLFFAKNGKEALKQIKTSLPNAVFLDMAMPIMDGYELSEIIRKSDSYNKLPLIAITASTLKQQEIKIKKLCNGYLHKPINRTEIVNELSKFIKHSIKKQKPIKIPKQISIVIPDKIIINEIYELTLDGDMDGICDYIDILLKKEAKFKDFCIPLKQQAEACNDTYITNILKKELL